MTLLIAFFAPMCMAQAEFGYGSKLKCFKDYHFKPSNLDLQTIEYPRENMCSDFNMKINFRSNLIGFSPFDHGHGTCTMNYQSLTSLGNGQKI